MKWSECKELIRKDYIQLVENSQISVSQAIVWGWGKDSYYQSFVQNNVLV